ncbi:MAG TPA: hypothetical protein VFQ41_19785 [Candidatus Angelobacter sp.]|nr:hypothetical protein [Candidatus Angelobacter sp.]
MIPLNLDFTFRGSEYSTTEASDVLARHRWYLIKEGFSPKLVNAAMDAVNIGKEDVVIDPFCGCGTVPVTAAERGVSAIGIEVNPFLSFVSKTKLSTCASRELEDAAASVSAALQRTSNVRSPLEGYSTFSKSTKRSKWLFNAQVLRSFERGWRETHCINTNSQRFARLALIKAAMANCNAKVDGKCLRYRKDWKDESFDSMSFAEEFKSNVAQIKEDLEKSKLTKGNSIVNGDSRVALKKIKQKFRLCITSPPYLNSFDYSDVYRPELFLGGYVEDTKELKRIRLKTLRSHVQVRWQEPTKTDFGSLYSTTRKDLLAAQGNLWDKRLPAMVQAYFEDMQNVLGTLFQAAADDAQVWIVVSTSAYGGVHIPVDMILGEIGERQGWFLHDIGVIRNIRHSSHHWSRLPNSDRSAAKLRESVVVLGKQRKA